MFRLRTIVVTHLATSVYERRFHAPHEREKREAGRIVRVFIRRAHSCVSPCARNLPQGVGSGEWKVHSTQHAVPSCECDAVGARYCVLCAAYPLFPFPALGNGTKNKRRKPCQIVPNHATHAVSPRKTRGPNVRGTVPISVERYKTSDKSVPKVPVLALGLPLTGTLFQRFPVTMSL